VKAEVSAGQDFTVFGRSEMSQMRRLGPVTHIWLYGSFRPVKRRSQPPEPSSI